MTEEKVKETKKERQAKLRLEKEARKDQKSRKRWFIAGLILVFFILGGAIVALLSYKPAPTAESVRHEFSQVVEDNLYNPNPAIAQMMALTLQVINGEKIRLDACPDVEMEVTLSFVEGVESRLLGVEPLPPTSDGKMVSAKFKYVVNVTGWPKWADVRTMHIWHESFHIKQACMLMQQVFEKSDPIGFQTLFVSYWERSAMAFEAYNVGVEGYWYHQHPQHDPAMLESEIGTTGYKIIDVWAYFFGTTEPRFWPPTSALPEVNELRNTRVTLAEAGGLPAIEAHPNYVEWSQFVEALYKDNQ